LVGLLGLLLASLLALVTGTDTDTDTGNWSLALGSVFGILPRYPCSDNYHPFTIVNHHYHHYHHQPPPTSIPVSVAFGETKRASSSSSIIRGLSQLCLRVFNSNFVSEPGRLCTFYFGAAGCWLLACWLLASWLALDLTYLHACIGFAFCYSIVLLN
jgi:hypothetical protein